MPAPPGSTGLNHIQLRGDTAEFDNSVAVIPPELARSKVLYLGTETEGESRQPLYFLRRAFPATRRQVIQVDVTKGNDAKLLAAARDVLLWVEYNVP